MKYDTKDHIEQLLRDEVNPALAALGGRADLVDLKPLGDSWGVYLDLSGDYAGFPGAIGRTLRSIEFLLREELSAPTLLVRNSAHQ